MMHGARAPIGAKSKIGLATALVAFAGVQASADTIQPAQYFTHLTLSTSTGTLGLPNDSTAKTSRSYSALGAFLSVTNDFDVPLLQAHASVPTGIGGYAQSILTYYIRFDGPTDKVSVNLQALGGISMSSGTSGIANANIIFDGTQYISCNACIFGSTTLNLNRTFELNTGQVYQIAMQALLNGISGGEAYAWIDPLFTVPVGYTIDISEGIGNSLATPLPAALPLFGSVLAGAGFLTWRRRRTAQRAA